MAFVWFMPVPTPGTVVSHKKAKVGYDNFTMGYGSVILAFVALVLGTTVACESVAAELRDPANSARSVHERLKETEREAQRERDARRDARAAGREKDQRRQENYLEERRQAGEEAGSN